MARVRIVLADDHSSVREMTLQQLEPEFEVVGAVEDGLALLEAVSRMKPDVCVVDISLPRVSGMQAAEQIKASGSKTRVVVLTVHEDQDFVRAALNRGVLGYVVKSRMASDLGPAIRAAMAGRLFVSPSCTFTLPGPHKVNPRV